MIDSSTVERIIKAVDKVRSEMNRSDFEIATNSNLLDCESLLGYKVTIDPKVPEAEIHIRYVDVIGRVQVPIFVDISKEIIAHKIAESARPILPTDADGMLVEFERQKEIDAFLVEKSKKDLAAGTITEDDLYRGDPLLRMNQLRFAMRSESDSLPSFMSVIPIPIDVIQSTADVAEKYLVPRCRHMIYTEALKHLAKV